MNDQNLRFNGPLRRVTAPLVALFAAWFCLAVSSAGAQIHPPEIRQVYPVGGSPGQTTRVTLSGVSFRHARKILFDQPGIAAKIVGPDFDSLPAPTIDNDNAPTVVADFTVSKDAPRDLFTFRIVSDAGVSSPGRWMVGRDLPQVEEKEPNNTRPQAQRVTLPIAVNGRIAEIGDTDTYAVELEAGKPFVAEVVAAQANSSLDSLVTLTDANGTLLAENDDFGGPDSLLVYTPKSAGRYFVTLSSSVGEGGPEHAYRLSLGYLPLLLGTIPATVPRGKSVNVTTIGVNVPPTLTVSLPADWRYGLAHIKTSEGVSSNAIIVGVADLPLVVTDGANIDTAHAATLTVPGAANGRFFLANRTAAPPFFYKFHVDSGKRIMIDVQCQDRSGARCDPLLTLYDSAGAVVAESDDSAGRDSHLDRTFDKGGDYTMRVKNQDGTNAPDLVYQVLIHDPPPPGFSLTTDTRARGVGRGGSAAFEVRIDRDHWSGPVTLTVADLPPGITANTVVVPDGVSQGLIVLTAAPDAPLTDFPLHITGAATIGGRTVTNTLTHASDRIWNGGEMSLKPAPVDTLYFAITTPYEAAVATEAKSVELIAGKSVKVHAKLTRGAGFDKPITLNALGLPEGVTVADVTVQKEMAEADIEIKAMPNARPGIFTIALDAMTANSPQVTLDRVSQPILLTVVAAKTAVRTVGARHLALNQREFSR